MSMPVQPVQMQAKTAIRESSVEDDDLPIPPTEVAWRAPYDEVEPV